MKTEHRRRCSGDFIILGNTISVWNCCRFLYIGNAIVSCGNITSCYELQSTAQVHLGEEISVTVDRRRVAIVYRSSSLICRGQLMPSFLFVAGQSNLTEIFHILRRIEI